MQDLTAGRIHVGILAVPSLKPHVQSGAARLLAVTSSARIAAAPDVPTSAEGAYPLLSADGKWGFYTWRDIPRLSATGSQRMSGGLWTTPHSRSVSCRWA